MGKKLPKLRAECPLRILVAEDNLINQKVIEKMLAQLGFTRDRDVKLVWNGQEALDACAERRFDMILMDLQMPVLDGLGATLALRKLYPPAELPAIVALTANVFQQQKDACLSAGMCDFLGKPVNRKRLAAAIKRVHGKKIKNG
jgi:CheY-like chemotaxis protein